MMSLNEKDTFRTIEKIRCVTFALGDFVVNKTFMNNSSHSKGKETVSIWDRDANVFYFITLKSWSVFHVKGENGFFHLLNSRVYAR